MTMLADFFHFLAQSLVYVIDIYIFVVIVACILSFVRPDPYNPVVRVIRSLTEPIFYFIRRRLPFVNVGGFDLSPLVLFFFLKLISAVFVPALLRFANSLALGL